MSPPSPEPVVPPHQLLEADVRLSQSMLWRLQEQVFTGQGLAAWDAVPYYITNNPFIARSYAELVIAFLLDCRASLDPAEPVYIVELAAGIGSLSFYFIQELLQKQQYHPCLRALKLCYVVTDIVPANLAFWENNPQFAPYIAAGVLDFALFRPESDAGFHLRVQDRLIDAGRLQNPLIAVANYFFDSIPQDMFRIKDGRFQEARFSFYRETGAALETDPFSQLVFVIDYRDADLDYYDDAAFNQVLKHYAAHLQDAPILYPIASLRTLRNLLQLANRRLVLISSDKGFTDMAFMEGREGYNFTIQGSISYMVNYDAIHRYLQQFGGRSLCSTARDLTLNTSMSVVLADALEELAHTRHYFQENLIGADAVNSIYECQYLLEPGPLDPRQVARSCMALVRLANYDPIVLAKCGERLIPTIAALEADGREELLAMLNRLARNFYPYQNQYLASFWLGKCFHVLGQLPQAVECYLRCIRLNAALPNAYFNLGLVLQELGQHPAAAEMLATYLALVPNDEQAGKIAQLVASLRGNQQSAISNQQSVPPATE